MEGCWRHRAIQQDSRTEPWGGNPLRWGSPGGFLEEGTLEWSYRMACKSCGIRGGRGESGRRFSRQRKQWRSKGQEDKKHQGLLGGPSWRWPSRQSDGSRDGGRRQGSDPPPLSLPALLGYSSKLWPKHTVPKTHSACLSRNSTLGAGESLLKHTHTDTQCIGEQHSLELSGEESYK